MLDQRGGVRNSDRVAIELAYSELCQREVDDGVEPALRIATATLIGATLFLSNRKGEAFARLLLYETMKSIGADPSR